MLPTTSHYKNIAQFAKPLLPLVYTKKISPPTKEFSGLLSSSVQRCAASMRLPNSIQVAKHCEIVRGMYAITAKCCNHNISQLCLQTLLKFWPMWTVDHDVHVLPKLVVQNQVPQGQPYLPLFAHVLAQFCAWVHGRMSFSLTAPWAGIHREFQHVHTCSQFSQRSPKALKSLLRAPSKVP